MEIHEDQDTKENLNIKVEGRKRVLITGGCGFIGHHMVEHILRNTNWDIVVLDKLNYASGGLEKLRDIKAFNEKRVLILTADFTSALSDGIKQEIGEVNYILHLGAETHVDNSITDPMPFVMANFVGTAHILNFARELDALEKFIYFSTDEVFGPAKEGEFFKEWDRYNCTNPYSACKAGAEELAIAYANTYKMPIVVSHCMNVFGERQHKEKFIPICVNKIMAGETIYIHSDETKTISGSRFWIHARNVAAATMFLLEHGETRDKYNIVGEKELSNLEVAQFVAHVLGKELKYEMVDFHGSRPGHDLRYALDGAKMHAMGWKLPMTFEDSMRKTIAWTLDNPKYL